MVGNKIFILLESGVRDLFALISLRLILDFYWFRGGEYDT